MGKPNYGTRRNVLLTAMQDLALFENIREVRDAARARQKEQMKAIRERYDPAALAESLEFQLSEEQINGDAFACLINAYQQLHRDWTPQTSITQLSAVIDNFEKAVFLLADALSAPETTDPLGIFNAKWEITFAASAYELAVKNLGPAVSTTASVGSVARGNKTKLELANQRRDEMEQVAARAVIRALQSGAFNDSPSAVASLLSLAQPPFDDAGPSLSGPQRVLHGLVYRGFEEIKRNPETLRANGARDLSIKFRSSPRRDQIDSVLFLAHEIEAEYLRVAGGISTDAEWLLQWASQTSERLGRPDLFKPHEIWVSPTIELVNALRRIQKRSPSIHRRVEDSMGVAQSQYERCLSLNNASEANKLRADVERARKAMFDAGIELIADNKAGYHHDPSVWTSNEQANVLWVDIEKDTVWWGETRFTLTPEQACLIKALIDARGEFVSAIGLGFTKVSTTKDALPEELKAIIESKSGKGYRLIKIGESYCL